MTSLEDRDALFAKAHELREAGDLGGAIDIMFELLSRNVQDRAVARDLASLLAQDDQLERAERLFQHALKITGDDSALAMNYGTFLGQAGRFQESRTLLEEQRARLSRQLSAAEQENDPRADEHREGLAICTLNLARSVLGLGEHVLAWSLAEPYLIDAGHWPQADNIVCSAAQQLGEELAKVARRLHAVHKASPLMVWQLAECVVVDTRDAVAAARVVIKATEYLPRWLLADVVEDEEEWKALARGIHEELVRRAEDNAAARRALKAFQALLDEARVEDKPPAPSRDDAPDAVFRDEEPVREVQRPTPIWLRVRKEQTAFQFGSDDLPLFAGKSPPRGWERVPLPVRPPDLGDEDFWEVNPRYWVEEDEWHGEIRDLVLMVLKEVGDAGETALGLAESGVPEEDVEWAIDMLLTQGDIEQMEERPEDGEPRYRICPEGDRR